MNVDVGGGVNPNPARLPGFPGGTPGGAPGGAEGGAPGGAPIGGRLGGLLALLAPAPAPAGCGKPPGGRDSAASWRPPGARCSCKTLSAPGAPATGCALPCVTQAGRTIPLPRPPRPACAPRRWVSGPVGKLWGGPGRKGKARDGEQGVGKRAVPRRRYEFGRTRQRLPSTIATRRYCIPHCYLLGATTVLTVCRPNRSLLGMHFYSCIIRQQGAHRDFTCVL